MKCSEKVESKVSECGYLAMRLRSIIIQDTLFKVLGTRNLRSEKGR